MLQTCPLQRKALLSPLGVSDDNSSTMIKFETHGIHPCFPYYESLLIHVDCLNNTIMRTMIDEGDVASMMSLACWKGLGSPTLSKSVNTLTYFDGISCQSHDILPSLEVQLGGNTVVIEVEVVALQQILELASLFSVIFFYIEWSN